MGRHNVIDTVGNGAGSSRAWVGRALLLATGVGSAMGAGVGMASAAPGLDGSAAPHVNMTDEYRGTSPSLQDAPSLDGLPSLGEAPAVPGDLPSLGDAPSMPSMDDAPVDGASVVQQLADSGMQGEGSFSGADSEMSGTAGDAGAQGSTGSDGGGVAVSGPAGSAGVFGTNG